MSATEFILWILLIPITEFFVLMFYDWWKERQKPSIGCDHCEEPKFLEETPDGEHFLCQECMAAYLLEHGEEMEADETDSH